MAVYTEVKNSVVNNTHILMKHYLMRINRPSLELELALTENKLSGMCQVTTETAGCVSAR